MSPEGPSGVKKFLVTSALPYANNDIHLGHLLEAVQTDVFVRYQKLRGNKAVYICADDTHGTPIELSALKKGISPEQLVNEARQGHLRDYAGFNISFDIFYTTNSEENRHYAELIYENLKKNGLIVERELDQFYCEKDKRFLPDRFIMGTCPRCKAHDQYGDVCEVCGATYEPTELCEPRCYICGEKPVLKKSKHLYVQLGKCEEFLRDFISNKDVLQEDMRNFVKSWIDDGLREWCISRDGPYFGFKIPGTQDKYFYVWLDAPVGYVSSTEKWCKDNGQRLEDYWGAGSGTEIVHFIGKDIVYFHALFWPVMLKNAGFNLPSRIQVHGFLNIQGEKMSKSRGTFILAREYLDKVKHPQAPEYLRFYFGSKLMPNTADIDLNTDELISRINTTLANNIGNLHHRTFVFCDRYFEKKIPDVQWDEAVATIVNEAAIEIAGYYERCEFKSVVEKVHALGSLGNKYYQDSQPWTLIKTSPEKAAEVMVTCVNLIKAIAVFLKPITPEMSSRVERQLEAVFSWKDYEFSLRNKLLGPTEKLVKPLETDDLAPLLATVVKKEPQAETGLIDIDQFKNVDLRVAVVNSAERVEKSSKLLRLQVEIGKEKRQIIAGIAAHYTPEQLVGRQVVVIANLKPATLFGLKSEGMLLAAKNADGSLIILQPEKQAVSGAKIS
ncbi:MAG: methionine--tRNA ligase [Fibrobacter sp.]|nr:methionine--tRNA ligase [Fibrobacter sp.]